jgi:hypothetical protein
MVLRSAVAAGSSAVSGWAAGGLPTASGAGTDACTGRAPRRLIHLPPRHTATAGWQREGGPIPPIVGAPGARRRSYRKRSCRGHAGLQREGYSLPTSTLRAYPSRRRSKAGQRKSSSLRWQWQIPPKWNPGSLQPYPNMNNRQQVSRFGPLM